MLGFFFFFFEGNPVEHCVIQPLNEESLCFFRWTIKLMNGLWRTWIPWMTMWLRCCTSQLTSLWLSSGKTVSLFNFFFCLIKLFNVQNVLMYNWICCIIKPATILFSQRGCTHHTYCGVKKLDPKKHLKAFLSSDSAYDSVSHLAIKPLLTMVKLVIIWWIAINK